MSFAPRPRPSGRAASDAEVGVLYVFVVEERFGLALQDDAAPGFPFAELTPAEAIRIARALEEAARSALRDGQDTAPLEAGRPPWFASRQAAG